MPPPAGQQACIRLVAKCNPFPWRPRADREEDRSIKQPSGCMTRALDEHQSCCQALVWHPGIPLDGEIPLDKRFSLPSMIHFLLNINNSPLIQAGIIPCYTDVPDQFSVVLPWHFKVNEVTTLSYMVASGHMWPLTLKLLKIK